MSSRLLRPWFQRAALLVLSVLLTLVALELFARAFHLGSGGFWEPHPLFGWRNIPGAKGWESCYGECSVRVEINGLGLRDEETTYAKPPDRRRVLVLGDSMTAGLQVPLEATFAERLEESLNLDGSSWEVLNAAVNGYGTDNELLYFQEEGYKFDADVVLLGVYLANDVYNNHRMLELRYGGEGHKPYFTLDQQQGLQVHNYPVVGSDNLAIRVGSFLKRNFQLPRFIAQTLRLRSQVPAFLRPIVELLGGDRGVEANERTQPQRRGRDICSPNYSPDVEEAWEITKALIKRLRDEVERQNAEFMVLVIPASPQVVPPTGDRDWYCDQANQELRGFLDEAGISYVDLLASFRSHALADGPPLYYERDFHLNELGHAVAAENIYSALVDVIHLR